MGDTQFTFAQVRSKNGQSGAPVWIVHKDTVYDVTSYISQHPGGDVIIEEAGTDATAAFEDSGHSADARQILAKYKIGVIVEEEKIYDANGKKKKRVVKADSGESKSCLSIVTCGLLG